MNAAELKNAVMSGEFDTVLERIYINCVKERKERICKAIDDFTKIYGDREGMMVLSVPGRSEISGNHTDHNYGKVVAGSVDCDILAIAAPTETGCVRIKSEGYPIDEVSLDKLKVGDYPNFKSSALVAGMCKAFLDKGYKVGGIDAYTTSNVLKGSGLSSSAAFEVMIGNMINHVYNEGKVANEEIAIMAQWSENVYFGKPCGLMDQMACAVGGFINIDFADKENPVIVKKEFDLSSYGYALCIVNTGGSHSDLNDDYASIPADMKSVARYFGKEVLRGISVDELILEGKAIREKCSDRAWLRAYHYVLENERVDVISGAMDEGNIDLFLEYIEKSGLSSYRYLQNVYSAHHSEEQGISLALALSEHIFASYKGDKKPVCRVHGGGFAGTMQAFVPEEFTKQYREGIDSVFGEGACMIMHVRPLGAIRIG